MVDRYWRQYVNVDKQAGRELFYVFVECKDKPEDAPVLLWLTGFHNFANVIYLDAPAFVGFSYSLNSSDRTVGHYIPTLVWEVLDYNQNTTHKSDMLNLQGFLAGNPSTDPEYDNEGRIDYWEIKHGCNFSNVLIAPGEDIKVHAVDKKCKKAVEDALGEMGPVDIQDIFADKCKKGGEAVYQASSLLSLLPRRLRIAPGAMRTKKPKRHLDPCISQEAEAYLARRDVQDALHANTSGELPWPYAGCTDLDTDLVYSKEDQMHSQLPTYRKIMEAAPKLKILIYTGDTDALVPLSGTRRWTFDLGREEGKKPKTHWRYWEDPDGQVGGFMEEYEDFTYLTIRHASHMAPYSQQGRTDYVYRTWLSKKDLV
ncbi:hypothetical protein N2152v2_007047 [Parachlorella kessleri]